MGFRSFLKAKVASAVESVNDVYEVMRMARDSNARIGLDIGMVYRGAKSLYYKSDGAEIKITKPLKADDPEVEKIKNYGHIAKNAARLSDTFDSWGDILYQETTKSVERPGFFLVEPRDDPKRRLIIIKPTQAKRDMLIDANAKEIDWPGTSDYGKVHRGLVGSTQIILTTLKEQFELFEISKEKHSITCLGYSLGGGVSTYMTAFLQEEGWDVEAYTYGCPPTFEEKAISQIKNITNTINGVDLVPRLCYMSFLYTELECFEECKTIDDAQRAALEREERTSKTMRTSETVIENDKEYESFVSDAKDDKQAAFFEKLTHEELLEKIKAEEESHPWLYHPGRYLQKVGDELEEVPLGDTRRRPKVIVSQNMMKDHKEYRWKTPGTERLSTS